MVANKGVGSHHWGLRYLGVFLLSLATLMLQVSYTRVLSVASWHHFVWMVVSIALLGYAASGTLLSVYPRIRETEFDHVLIAASILFSISTLLSYIGSIYIPFDPAKLSWDRLQLVYITIFYLLLATPFLFSGLAIALAIERAEGRINRLYFSNLIGSALGSVAVLPLFGLLEGPGMMALSSALGGASTLAFALNLRGRRSAFVVGWVIVTILFVPCAGDLLPLRISPYKSLEIALRYPNSMLLETRWNAFSRVDVVESGMVRYAPGLSLRCDAPIPEQIGVTVDGDNLNAMTRYDGTPSSIAFTRFLPSSLPYRLVDSPMVLVVGAGGGLDVLKALYHGSKNVVALESNPIIVELVQGEYGDFSGGIYLDERVRVVASDGRNFIKGSRDKYDIIELSMAHGASASSTGIYALSENYLYTVESFREFILHLSEDGFLSVSMWLLPPPREDVRIVSLALSALEDIGITEAVDHMAVIRSWGTITLIVKRTPLGAGEIEAVRGFCEELGFDIVYVPDVDPSEVNVRNRFPEPIYYKLVNGILHADDRRAFYDGYLYDIGPTTDERPFFFLFFKWDRLVETYRSLEMKWEALIEGGYLVPLTFLQALAISVLLVLLPLRRFGGAHIGGSQALLVYFFCLGLGYMFAEMAYIQRFMLVLSHPTYSISAVIFSLLLASGLGSYFSGRLTPGGKEHKLILIIVGLLTPISGFTSSHFQSLLSMPIITRLFATFTVIAPLGLLMGMPFPLGLRMLTGSRRPLIPWAWAINGCASVLGSILPIIVAIFFGYSRVFMIAGLGYIVSLFMIIYQMKKVDRVQK
jgi:hypothetical protein